MWKDKRRAKWERSIDKEIVSSEKKEKKREKECSKKEIVTSIFSKIM